VSTFAQLVERGCLCGSDRVADCPLHRGPGDLRGIAAYFKAGMPKGFPMVAHCAICKTEGLMYPNIELDDAKREAIGDAKRGYKPTLICPCCSTPAAERALRIEVEGVGYYDLNQRSVFGLVAA
jgi:hypothetical protein